MAKELPIQFERHISGMRLIIANTDPRFVMSMTANIAAEMKNLAAKAEPTLEQQRRLAEAMQEVEQATAVLERILLVPAMSDHSRNKKIEIAQDNVIEKIDELEILMEGIEISYKGKLFG